MLRMNYYGGNLFLLSLTSLVIIVSLELAYNILPFGGIFLSVYLLFVLFLTIWFTWNYFQTLLKQSKPMLYNFDTNAYLKAAKHFYSYAHGPKKETIAFQETKQTSSSLRSIDDRIDDFVKDVENLFILKWYSQISSDDTFLIEIRNLLDEVIRRFLQIVILVDNKKLVQGILKILLKHVKEYRKSVKRQQRNGGSIVDLYRYAHIGSKNNKAFEHFLCQVTTKVLRQFINWELYNSLPCKCLTSILAKKLTTYILIYISNPTFLNYKLAQACASTKTKSELELAKFEAISLSDIDHSENIAKENSIQIKKEDGSENKLLNGKNENVSTTPKISPRKIDDKLVIKDQQTSVDTNLNVMKAISEPKIPPIQLESEVNETISTHATSKPVKIYESKSIGETWRNSSDLATISLGEDLLVLEDIGDPDAQIAELIEKRLWKDNFDSLEVDEKGEEIKDVASSSPSPSIPAFLTNTMKPIGSVTASTLHNMKELQQSTVNNVVKPVSQVTSSAMHKIGDLQDEAAGMMEGILDFGRAGIRKGLRLTGLHDNIADHLKRDALKILDLEDKQHQKRNEKNSQKQKPIKLAKIPHVTSDEIKSSDQQSLEENIWLNPLIKESPNYDGQLLLEKSPIISPQPNFSGVVPNISTDDINESPDLEYEDTTDLATTTAKLRSLLQQKSSESNLTTPALSPMPTDDFNKASASDSNEDITEVDKSLPSLYKFCARTATGVFQNTLNTIKTALPGNVSEQEHADDFFNQQSSVDNWTFVASDPCVDDLMVHVERLLNERRIFCTLDNAYEAIESLDMLDHDDVIWSTTPIKNYDDELDDFDVHIPITKALVDVFCELVADTDTLLIQESVVKIFLIYFGMLCEDYVNDTSSKLIRNIKALIGKVPSTGNKDPKSMKLSELSSIVMEILPGFVKKIIGERDLNCAATTFISCFQCHKINQDVALQLFELIALLIIDASNKMSPTYSA